MCHREDPKLTECKLKILSYLELLTGQALPHRDKEVHLCLKTKYSANI